MQIQYKLPQKDKEGYDNGTLDTYFFVVKGTCSIIYKYSLNNFKP